MRPHKLYQVLVFFFVVAVAVPLAPAGAADFVVVAEPDTAGQDFAARIGASHTVSVVSTAEAEAWSAAEWSQHAVVWLIGASEETSTTVPARPWHKLTRSNGALAQFVSAGGVLVVLAPRTSRIGIDVSPTGADFSPHALASPSAIQAPNHPLVSGGTYGGNTLASDDFAEAASPSGCWLNVSGATVIAADAHGPTVAEAASGSGRILLVGVGMSSSGSLAGNLIGYARSLRP